LAVSYANGQRHGFFARVSGAPGLGDDFVAAEEGETFTGELGEAVFARNK
jgi:hypothetical protein